VVIVVRGAVCVGAHCSEWGGVGALCSKRGRCMQALFVVRLAVYIGDH
jgi:hypothetical protein